MGPPVGVVGPRGDRGPDPVKHLPLALADLLGVEPQEAAVLGRAGGGLRRSDQPGREGFSLVRGRLGSHDRLDSGQLDQHLFTGGSCPPDVGR